LSKILIIGYGSIGKRHAKNVISLGHKVVLLRHSKGNANKENFREYYSFEEAIKHEGRFDGAIVCSPTSKHLRDLTTLIQHKVPFLLEKPPAADLSSTIKMRELLVKNRFKAYDIAFNLRYYPILQFIKSFIPKLGKMYCARVCADYYLPDWRKGIDYRQTSSAKRELGGGVYIELSHEIDYILWFFGFPEKVVASIDKVSDLEISTEDICSSIFKYRSGFVVELHLGYLSRELLRGCSIIAENGTLEWSIADGKVFYSDKARKKREEVFKLDRDYDLNDTYIKEFKNFLKIMDGESDAEVDIEAALNVMRIVDAIKVSSRSEKFVKAERR